MEPGRARRRGGKWHDLTIDLAPRAGTEVVVRLYQDILVRNGFPGNAC